MLLLFGFLLGLICSGLAWLSFGLGPRAEGRGLASPFECGFDPVGGSRVSFSVRFFLIAVVFLIFDVEIALLLPLTVLQKVLPWGMWLGLSSGFLLLLMFGTYLEWQKGALDWKECLLV